MFLAKDMEFLDGDVVILVTRLMDFVLERTIWSVGFEEVDAMKLSLETRKLEIQVDQILKYQVCCISF